MDWQKVNHFVLEKQHLTSKSDDVVSCVEDIAGLNSITATTPYLSLFNRIHDFRNQCLMKKCMTRRGSIDLG